ncbi:GDSL-type esterase/lipase family protein [Streptomyces sp. NPDC053048]|uniref:GDSL-type esterase/lipase family protein n=1 Tax=Streptomyces sp. NPDC053048 TaxID=3365694 RepID=UPI0037D37261
MTDLSSRRTPARRPALVAVTLPLVLTLAAVTGCGAPEASGSGRTAEETGAAGRKTTIISMGDSYISGEAGRWWANAAYAGTDTFGDRWGTDRSAKGCDNRGKNCSWPPDEREVYSSSRDVRMGRASGSCHRSDIAEIESAGIKADFAENLACSGAKTLDILERWRRGEPPQIAELTKLAKDKKRKIELIQVSIGGNDMGFAGIIRACYVAYETRWKLKSCRQEDPDLQAKLDEAKPKIVKTLKEIRTVMKSAGYRDHEYRLGIQSYPSPLPAGTDNRYKTGILWEGERWNPGGCPFGDEEADWSRKKLVPEIAKMIKEAAKETGADFLDLQHAFEGHEVCRKGVQQSTESHNFKNPLPASEAEWVRYMGFGIEQGSIQESLHPNAYGQMALGDCLRKAYELAKKLPAGSYECRGGVKGRGPLDMAVTPIK